MGITERQIRTAAEEHELQRISRTHRSQSAVLIPLIPTDGGYDVLFEVRSRKIIQGGEICFPGGAIEPPENPHDTAVRETCEELLVEPSQIEVLSPMHVIPGPGGADVTSYLGFLYDYRNTYSEDEVDHILRLSLDSLVHESPIMSEGHMVFDFPEDFPFDLIPGGRSYPWAKVLRTYYFYKTENDGAIWGITGELLYYFLKTLKES